MSASSGREPVIPVLEPASAQHENNLELLSAFRTHYYRFGQAIHETTAALADSNVLARLGDDLDEYSDLVTQVCAVVLLYLASTVPGFFSMPLFSIRGSSLPCRRIL
jgi:hypothetical protein